jgi:signal transduction histidine kinase
LSVADLFREHILDRLPVAICACNQLGVITDYNRRAVELWAREPRPGERFSGAVSVYDANGRLVNAATGPIAMVLRSGRAQRNTELILEKPDGTRISTLSSIAPILDDDGSVVGAIDAFQDITERRRSEEARRIAERLATSARLAASVAQQIKAPLDSIAALLESLRNEVSLSDDSRRRAEAVGRQLSMFDKLAREMLHLSTAA